MLVKSIFFRTKQYFDSVQSHVPKKWELRFGNLSTILYLWTVFRAVSMYRSEKPQQKCWKFFLVKY